MNLDEFAGDGISSNPAVDFLNRWSGEYRFWDQSAINFLLYGQIRGPSRAMESRVLAV